MAEIPGLGMSHFGGLMFPDADMASRARARVADGSLPGSLDHPSVSSSSTTASRCCR